MIPIRHTRRWPKAIALLAALGLGAFGEVSQAQTSLIDRLGAVADRARQAAQAQVNGVSEVRDDAGDPQANAVVRLGRCSGVLIAPDLVLTAAHCAPRAGQAGPAPVPDCARLPQQSGLARHPTPPPNVWLTVKPAHPRSVSFGPLRASPVLEVRAEAVALPRCADMALIRLVAPVPGHVAAPLPVVTTPPLSPNRVLGRGPLRYAGWGRSDAEAGLPAMRQKGPVTYWGRNACTVIALPPVRPNGRRLLSGDSGSPLILTHDGEDVVAGVLFARGVPDLEACGQPRPAPPPRHGTYTATWRPQVPGTGATDIGAWLRSMAPQAEHR